MPASAAERTEPPTARRLRDARRKGQVAVSRDLSSAAAFAAGVAALVATAPGRSRRFEAELVGSVERACAADDLAMSEAVAVVGRVVWLVARVSFPVGLAALCAGVLLGGAQSHGLVAVAALAPKLERLDPVRGLKRLGQARTLVEAVKTWLKVVIAATAVVSAAGANRAALAGAASTGPDALLAFAALVVRDGAARAAVALAVLAAADVIVQRRLHLRELRMTRDEVRRDQKEDEGDPHVKSARRQAHREIAAEQMLVATRSATVVLVNPTHVAVARCAMKRGGNRHGRRQGQWTARVAHPARRRASGCPRRRGQTARPRALPRARRRDPRHALRGRGRGTRYHQRGRARC